MLAVDRFSTFWLRRLRGADTWDIARHWGIWQILLCFKWRSAVRVNGCTCELLFEVFSFEELGSVVCACVVSAMEGPAFW